MWCLVNESPSTKAVSMLWNVNLVCTYTGANVMFMLWEVSLVCIYTSMKEQTSTVGVSAHGVRMVYTVARERNLGANVVA